jgi:AsmA-like C-terminal region
MISENSPMRFDRRKLKFVGVTIGTLSVVLVLVIVLFQCFWPFTESAMRSRLTRITSAEVHFESFHKKYFPPGCVMEGVVFQRANSNSPFVTIQRLTIESNIFGLFRHQVSVLRSGGVHVTLAHSDIAAVQSSREQLTREGVTIDQVMADNAVLDISQGRNLQPLRFVFRELHLRNIGDSGATKFSAIFENPLPAGVIQTSGEFGPWNQGDVPSTPLSGKYSLADANLGVLPGIGGTITSSGDFTGTLEQIEVHGSTTSPNFEVVSTQHRLPLESRFRATVNATTGEIVLREVQAKFGHDEIQAHGSIARGSDGRRTADLELACDQGRIEDTLYPIVSSSKSPISGDIQFRMHVVVPSVGDEFLERLQLSGDFRMWNAEFTNPQTELRLSKVAERPHQKAPLKAEARIQGKVDLNNGMAQLSNVSMRDDGASAMLFGSFNVLNERVNMHGKLKTEASLTKTTSGIKAAFAKAIEPFFKKRRHQAVVPVKISGTYHHPNFGLDL